MLRFLAPNRHSRSSSPAPSSSRSRSRQPELQPRLTIRVPSYGSVFMDASHQGASDSIDPSAPPEAGPSTHRTDRESRGELEVEIPQGMGRVRVKAIRVGMRTETELTLGEGRVKEKDVIFERKVEVRGGNAEGIILEEGVQRFDFVLLIPSNLCSHDKHPNGRINHFLYGELEGLADSRATSRSQTRMSTRSATPRSSRSKSPMPGTGSSGGTATPRSPIEGDESAVNPASLASALSMSITRQEGSDFMPPVPPYEAAEEREATWLRGSVRKERYIELLYNCQPEGGVTELDVMIRDAVPGLGPFEVQLESDCWTIGGLLTGKLSLPAPGSDITIFSFRVSLIQTHTILSPRDDPATAEPNVTTQTYPLFTIGTRPAAGDKNPGLRTPALWRGIDAKGTRTGEVELKAHGRNPADTLARPSSVPNVPTPIQVTHKLAIEVLFSVWAEDEAGQTLPMGGPGAVRALMIKKNTVVASCAFTPEELRLPSYGSVVHEDAFSRLARKCPLCGREPHEKLCQTCPPSAIPHPRHDHPAKLVGNETGVCPLCAEEVMPRREPNFEDCACGMDTAYLLERMEKRQRGTSAGGRAGDRRLAGGPLVKGMSDLSVGDS